MKIIWEVEIYPHDWSKALVQPIYKGDAKPRVDPASYRGIYLTRPRDHPQKTTTLKVVDSFKYLGVSIDKDLAMGPLHTLIRDNIQKANGKLQGLLRDLKSSRELHSSHHTTLGRASTSPKTIGLLWKSCVLVHATQYIRYIHSPTQLKTIQTQLNKSLQSTFGCSGLPSSLQAELGIPPLQYYQMKQLASSHFRLTQIHQHALPGQIYAFRTHNLPHLDPIDLSNDGNPLKTGAGAVS
jgi:hypothetical protein